MSSSLVIAASLTLVAALAPQEQGEFGTTYPQPAVVVVEGAPVHADAVGGAEQELYDLAGSPYGVAGVWRDTRYGSLALVLGLVGPDGNRSRLEVSVSDKQTARQFDPTVAIGGDFTGGVAWFGTGQSGREVMLRLFAGESGFVSAPIPVERGADGGRGGGRAGGGRSPGARPMELQRPGLGIDDQGRGLVVWFDGEHLRGQRFQRGAPQGRGGFAPEPLGDRFDVGAGGPEPTGVPLVALTGEGDALVAWPTAKGTSLWTDATSNGRLRSVKLATIARAVPRADGAGWWLLGERRGDWRVLGVDPSLSTETVFELPDGTLSADLAAVGDRLAIVAERAPAEGEGPFVLRLVDGEGEPEGPPQSFPTAPADARGVRLAASGETLIAAWTDRRDGHGDVRYTAFDVAAGGLSAGTVVDELWNQDELSSDQSAADLALVDGSGWIVWEDLRHGTAAVYARRVGEGGAAGAELRLSPPDRDARRPSVALAADGHALVVWKAGAAGAERVEGRILASDGELLGPARELDPSKGAAREWPAAVEALADGTFAVLFSRDDDELVLARVDASGAVDGRPRALGRERGARLRHPDLTTLDDGRLLALWDVAAPDGPPELAGRLLTAALKPTGSDLSFESADRDGGDSDPAAAPGPDGGFVVAWTGREGPLRDVVARRFDRRGKAEGAVLPISVRATEQDNPCVVRTGEAEWVVVWEDDISNYDQVLGRRFDGLGRMGPRVTLNRPETDFVEARSRPTVAVTAEGLAVAWTDRRRSQGLDVFLKIVGRAFDNVGGPSIPGRR